MISVVQYKKSTSLGAFLFRSSNQPQEYLNGLDCTAFGHHIINKQNNHSTNHGSNQTCCGIC